VTQAAEDRWSNMVNTYAAAAPFDEASYFFGANIPGKPIRYLLNPGGRPLLQSSMAHAVENGFDTFTLGLRQGLQRENGK
jgi:hypothetical protein